MTDQNKFVETVLKNPESVKQYLIDYGNEGKSTSPISFFREEDKEKFLRKE